MNEFENKSAIVTGTTGIGRAIALRFARAGAQVLACGIDEAANEQLACEGKRERLTIFVRNADVSNVDHVRECVSEAKETLGALHIIVNAAAVHPYGSAVETELEEWN